MSLSFLRPVRIVLCVAAALLLGGVSSLGAADPFPGLDAKWRYYESPHFELYSRDSDGASRNMLRSLEGMRAFFLEYFGLEAKPVPRVAVYAFSNARNLKAYASGNFEHEANLVGEYRGWPDRDFITLSTMNGQESAMWIVYSNYSNHLLNASGGRGRPSWLYQGLSMLLGNLEVRGNSIDFGKSDLLRARLTRENPKVDLAQLFRAEEGRSFFRAQDQANIFHAQAWGVLHYFLLGQSEVKPPEVCRFLRFALLDPAAADEAAVEARFRECFKTDYAEMERRIASYLRRSSFSVRSIRLPASVDALAVSSRTMDVNETRHRLADLALRNRRDPAGKFVLLEALDGPRAARAAEALGVDAAIENDDRQAQDYWSRAVAAGSDNPVIVNLAAQMEFARWFATTDLFFRLPAEKTDELRTLISRAIRLMPGAPENYEALAWVESAAPQPAIANVNLVQSKFETLREKTRTLLALAIIRSRLADYDGALGLIETIESSPVSTDERRFAQRLRAQVEKQRTLATN